MRVLVTNDDGIDAPGLRVLTSALVAAGHQVTVAAPVDDRSGAGTSLRLRAGQSVRLRRYTDPDLPGVPLVAVDGSPGYAVLLAGLGVLGEPPRCVVSGINHGPNTGRSILSSGTVGAALTAATLGMSALAVSVAAERPKCLDAAATVAGAALSWLAGAPKRTVLNVNVPDLPIGRLRGIRWGRLAASGATKAVVAEIADEHVMLELEPTALPVDPTTDAGLVAAGYVAVTSLAGVCGKADDGAAAEIERRL